MSVHNYTTYMHLHLHVRVLGLSTYWLNTLVACGVYEHNACIVRVMDGFMSKQCVLVDNIHLHNGPWERRRRG